jgi:hypothetical protein
MVSRIVLTKPWSPALHTKGDMQHLLSYQPN